MLELIFQGFMEWFYGLALECWEYFSSSLLGIMSMDYAYMKSHVPVMDSIAQMLLAAGWALLLGNLVFQALRSMASGIGFDGEDPKLLFTRTFVFSFLLLASPQICEIGLKYDSEDHGAAGDPRRHRCDAGGCECVRLSRCGVAAGDHLRHYHHVQGIPASAGDRRTVCDPRRAYHNGAAGVCHGRQQKHLRDI